MALSYNPWTTETTTTFVQLWEQGESFSQIAKQMHMTRNALIGKALRMGLKRGKYKRAEPEAKEPKPKPKAKTKTNGHAPDKPNGAAREIEPTARTLFTLQYFNCRFPLWSDEGQEDIGQKLYCGAPRDMPLAYCAKHARITSHRS